MKLVRQIAYVFVLPTLIIFGIVTGWLVLAYNWTRQ